jgi:hypothetical protein
MKRLNRYADEMNKRAQSLEDEAAKLARDNQPEFSGGDAQSGKRPVAERSSPPRGSRGDPRRSFCLAVPRATSAAAVWGPCQSRVHSSRIGLYLTGADGTVDLSSRIVGAYSAAVFDNGLTAGVAFTGSTNGDYLQGSAYADVLAGALRVKAAPCSLEIRDQFRRFALSQRLFSGRWLSSGRSWCTSMKPRQACTERLSRWVSRSAIWRSRSEKFVAAQRRSPPSIRGPTGGHANSARSLTIGMTRRFG